MIKLTHRPVMRDSLEMQALVGFLELIFAHVSSVGLLVCEIVSVHKVVV